MPSCAARTSAVTEDYIAEVDADIRIAHDQLDRGTKSPHTENERRWIAMCDAEGGLKLMSPEALVSTCESSGGIRIF